MEENKEIDVRGFAIKKAIDKRLEEMALQDYTPSLIRLNPADYLALHAYMTSDIALLNCGKCVCMSEKYCGIQIQITNSVPEHEFEIYDTALIEKCLKTRRSILELAVK